MSVTFKRPFKAQAHAGNGGSTTKDIPLGDQVVTIIGSKKLRSKAGNDMLVFDLRTDAKEFGAVFVNLWHTNPVAKEIAVETLARICTAAGVTEMTDTHQLHGKRLLVKVGRDDRGYVTFMHWRNAQ